MAQLGELEKSAEKFAEHNVEVIAVFREEREGVAGLQKIKDKIEADFTLALDTGKENTGKYSPGRREFASYVIDKSGVIQAVISGDLRNRAKSNELLETIKKFDD